MLVTPEMAAAWLSATQLKNRRVDRKHVARLARQIAEGKFVMTGESIILSRNGDLLDGQHRLLAIVKAGKPVYSIVVRGVDPKVFTFMDSGKGRSDADALGIDSRERTTTLAACLRLIFMAEKNELGSASYNIINRGYDRQEMFDLLSRYSGVEESVARAYRFYREFQPLSKSLFAFLDYWLRRYDDQLATEFVERLASGEMLKADSPIHRLRSRLIENYNSKASLPQREILALCIKAWRAYATGTPVKFLRWRNDGNNPEDFPNPDPLV